MIFAVSGHSKWSTIKRDKAVNDAKRSQSFSKLSRLISVAAKKGDDPSSNPALRLAVEKAKEARMPKDNIEKAILKGSGKLAGELIDEIVYEGFGPLGTAFMVKTVTDNRNRTVAELRTIFSRAGGSLGASGSTAYIFGPDPRSPLYTTNITDAASADMLFDFVESLEDHDDVSEVFYNFKIASNL